MSCECLIIWVQSDSFTTHDVKQAEKTEHGETLHSGNYTSFIRNVGGMLVVHDSMTLPADYLCHLTEYLHG